MAEKLACSKPNCGHAHAPPPAATPAGLSHKHALPRRGQSKMDSLDGFSDILMVKRNARAVSLSVDAEVLFP